MFNSRHKNIHPTLTHPLRGSQAGTLLHKSLKIRRTITPDFKPFTLAWQKHGACKTEHLEHNHKALTQLVWMCVWSYNHGYIYIYDQGPACNADDTLGGEGEGGGKQSRKALDNFFFFFNDNQAGKKTNKKEAKIKV